MATKDRNSSLKIVTIHHLGYTGSRLRKRKESAESIVLTVRHNLPNQNLASPSVSRTRGTHMRYTFSDDDDDDDVSLSTIGPRHSTRMAANAAELSGPTVRNRVGGLYGETLCSGQTIR
ncbi:hypothetical protein K432DRAFT_376739 [Lepidopterella palustris CBS 459.81]|uniref:Uncharacterized protein n=1 Tax=Lepidopterella palustris CBS 459.81 TaxID=1314670 RepID=A0A8E2EM51_9PEZI|nr:hypothetical protein K432DRAFT_376739 [Lepidopterella palustris CBS 459.81]